MHRIIRYLEFYFCHYIFTEMLEILNLIIFIFGITKIDPCFLFFKLQK